MLIPISGFRRVVDKICALLRYNGASSGNSAPNLRDNLPKVRCVLATRRCLTSQKSADLMAVNAGKFGRTFPMGSYLGGPLKGVFFLSASHTI